MRLLTTVYQVARHVRRLLVLLLLRGVVSYNLAHFHNVFVLERLENSDLSQGRDYINKEIKT